MMPIPKHKRCRHRNWEFVGTGRDDKGGGLLFWCPDCGALKDEDCYPVQHRARIMRPKNA